MPKTNLPTAADLQGRLAACGMISNPPTANQMLFILEDAVNTAYAQWELDTGYRPFIAATQTRKFTPPGPSKGGPISDFGYAGLGAISSYGGSNKLFLRTGLTVLTSLTIGVSPTDTGTALTVNRDFFLRPENALLANRPYTEIVFEQNQRGIRDSIVIVGEWGFCPFVVGSTTTWTIPDDAWSAILDAAMVEIGPQLSILVSGGLLEWKEADVSEKYGANPYQAQVEAASMRYQRAVNRYRLPGIF